MRISLKRSTGDVALSAALAGAPVWAVPGALLLVAVIMLGIGTNPTAAFGALADGAFGSPYSLGITINKATPLILAGLGALFSFRAGVFNIGQEGQLYLGGLAATWIGISLTNLPPVFHIFVSLAGGFAAGALWAFVPAILKTRRGVNEIISTLLLNYVAMYLVSFLAFGPLRGPETANYQTAPVAASAELPFILPATRLHAGFLVALACVIAIYVVLWRTPFGLEVRAVGSSPRAARHAGIDVSRTVVLTVLISGGLAGLAGAVEILGVQHVLMGYFSPGYGYSGIVAALIGQSHPAGTLVASVFLGALRAGGSQMQRAAGVPVTMAYVTEGIMVLFVIAGVALRHRAYVPKITHVA
ncbi:MAG: ABC transporter permease [Chloroflexi bacterium]|nr:ABC transporter permease [Chloroflexota bacterium]